MSELSITGEDAPRPSSYRGSWPYRATAVTTSVQFTYATGRGVRLQLRWYSEEFVFVFRRALVALTVTRTGAPLSANARAFLEGVLVGRAEANWGWPR